ncbi:hypothetical protein B0H13DRAFT_2334804 [Mycena leptocephala]|nr:hypothetical protein B0H13DRAFT_2334804 [Mycena leptocephala]
MSWLVDALRFTDKSKSTTPCFGLGPCQFTLFAAFILFGLNLIAMGAKTV